MSTPNSFDLTQFLPYLLNQAAEASSRGFQQTYRDRYGMLRTEWRVLFHLGLYGPMSATEIRDRAGLHKTKVSRAVAKLCARRFVSRTRAEEDRRFEHLSLTPAGRAAYEDLHGIAEAYDAALTQQLGAKEVAALRKTLQSLAVAPLPPAE